MRKRAEAVIVRFSEYFPQDPTPALHFANPYQCVVSISLSAQTTDANVNKVTPLLFERYPDTEKLAQASQGDVETIIHSLGFYHDKAKNIIALAQKVQSDFGGEIPETMEELVTLSGVGRKTANLVLSESFHVTAGIAVDTHVFRVSHRLGLSNATTPEKTEGDLCAVFPQTQWRMVNFWMINMGRRICDAKKPQCTACFLSDICPKKSVTTIG
ncbi:MAG: endonuclease III [Coriobacteriia bacterium]|nr:endonuclease III [Coriobacteriia bacterium]